LPKPLPHRGGLWRAHFSPDGRRIVTSSWDHTARIWDTQTGRPVGKALQQDDRLFGAAFSPNGQAVFTWAYDGVAQKWDARTGQTLGMPLRHASDIRGARISSNGDLVVTASGDHQARIWNTQTGELLRSLSHLHGVGDAVFHPEKNQVLTVASNSVQVWDVQTGERVLGPILLDGYTVVLQFSHNGRHFLTASDEGTAQIWDTLTGRPVTPPLKHSGKIRCARFSPDDRWVGTASWDNSARLWNAHSGEPVGVPMQHKGRVNWIEFSPDGRRVVTASADNSARVWNALTGQPISEPFEEEDEVRMAEFSPDGDSIVTAPSGNRAHVWEVPSAPMPAPLWLADLAEAVAGERITTEAVSKSVSASELLRLKDQFINTSSRDSYARWAKWFFQDLSTRTISPGSPVALSDYLEQRRDENSVESLQEVIRLQPTNGLAMARLARQMVAKDALLPREYIEAEWLSHRAAKLCPSDQEVGRIRAEVDQQAGSLPGDRSEEAGSK
jgi:WD40 repeat protein